MSWQEFTELDMMQLESALSREEEEEIAMVQKQAFTKMKLISERMAELDGSQNKNIAAALGRIIGPGESM